jgi:uncharacterized protein (TIGR03067 family)
VATAASLAAGEPPTDQTRLLGTWEAVKVEMAGVTIDPRETRVPVTVTVTAEKLTITDGGGPKAARYRLDASKSPAWIDVVSEHSSDRGKTYLGIYELQGDTLKLCFSQKAGERPIAFTTKPDQATHCFHLRREKK